MYGPYSEELTLRVEELCEMGFLNEQRIDKGSYVQYQYDVSGEGQRFLEMADKVPDSLSGFHSKNASEEFTISRTGLNSFIISTTSRKKNKLKKYKSSKIN